MLRRAFYLFVLTAALDAFACDGGIHGRVLDPSGALVDGGNVTIEGKTVRKHAAATGEADGFAPVWREVAIADGQAAALDVQFESVAGRHDSIVIRGTEVEPEIDMRDGEVYNRTWFWPRRPPGLRRAARLSRLEPGSGAYGRLRRVRSVVHGRSLGESGAVPAG